MGVLSVLFKSTLEEGEVNNQVVGQVRGISKALREVSKFHDRAGLIGNDVEFDENGVTRIGTDPDTGERVAFSSAIKGSL
jgi:hypothetical protein